MLIDILTPEREWHLVKKVSKEWVRGGHQNGQNTHNVSATVTIKPDEWEIVGDWMWDNREYYNGLSVLPYADHTYKQAPFEDCTKEEYETMLESLKEINLENINEEEDNTDLQGEIACAGGACELPF